jgi:hypothetical protein
VACEGYYAIDKLKDITLLFAKIGGKSHDVQGYLLLKKRALKPVDPACFGRKTNTEYKRI